MSYLTSLKVAISTLLCLVIGYPMAYAIARSRESTRNILLLLVILPFWTFLLRVYAWIGLLKNNGFINNTLMALGLIDQPIQMMQTDFAVYLGIVYSYLPFMILPLYTNLVKLDLTLLEAAADLGSRPWESFLKITLPLSVPGIIAGCMLVFIPRSASSSSRRCSATRDADDRQGAVDRVFQQPRLAGGECGGDRTAPAAGDPDHDLPAFPRSGGGAHR